MIIIQLALSFLRVGLLGFGGGYAMIPLIQREVLKFGIRGSEFIDILAISQMTPGPIGVNAATYTGFKIAGLLGSFISTFSNVFPTFIIMIIVAKLFYRFRKNAFADAFFKGIRPVFIGLIAASVCLMVKDIKLWSDYKAMVISIAVFIAGYRFRVNPLFLILLSAVTGLLIY